MTRTIGLAIAVVLVLGLGIWVYTRKKAGKTIFGSSPPVYSGYGPGPTGSTSPPIGKAPITSTLQDINSVVQGGDQILMSGKKAWDDVKSFFDNTDTGSNSEAPVTSDTDWDWA